MELSVESPCQHITWKIHDFFELPSEVGYSLDSPEFRFADSNYYLRLYPNGALRHRDEVHTEFHIMRLTSTATERNISCTFGSRWRCGERHEMDIYKRTGTLFKKLRYSFSRSDIERDRDWYISDGTFTAVCYMCQGEQSSSGSSQCEEPKTSEAEQEQEVLPDMAKVLFDYSQLLEKGAESDACLVVSEKEFRAHKNILRARSPVFDAMFDHETVEKETGRVVIDDLDPETFGDFLEYLYTGMAVVTLSDDNAFGLYAAADKYDVPTLKSICVAHMRKNISVDSFCDVIILALLHQEEKLLQEAVRFFKDNMARIIVTVKWQQFVIDNGVAANELLVKALVPREQ